jgi:(E)-4-hydroxy-3-methylbut-2-enyl-diphosphate synthase
VASFQNAEQRRAVPLPGTFEEPKAPVCVDGRLFTTLKGDNIVAEFIKILDEYVESHYAAREEVAAK